MCTTAINFSRELNEIKGLHSSKSYSHLFIQPKHFLLSTFNTPGLC